MPTVTQNYGIKKPIKGEKYDLVTINENADIIDESIKEVDDRISTIIAQSGTSDTEVVDARGGFTVLNDRLDANDTYVADTKVKATNLVTNGDFSNGTTGWAGYQATLAIESLFLKATTTGASPSIFQTSLILLNSKIYVKAEMKTALAGRTFQIKLGSNGTSNVTSLADTFVVVSGIITSPTNNPNIDYNMRGHTIGEAYFIKNDSAISINLTTLFGAGKEPTVAQVDWLLAQKYANSWFDGTAELTSILDLLTLVNTKANIAQEAWITPTLLNGATGTLQYRRNSTGRLEFRGTISKPTSGTSAFQMATGYRVENETRVQVGCSDTTAGWLAFFPDGVVFVLTVNKTYQMGSLTLI